ncbi:MAG: radical SAM protein [Parvularculaceae bacterium]
MSADEPPAPETTRGKFEHPDITASGAPRATVAFAKLRTLWINTGTLCNIECAHCYIESSPSNDRLVYLSAKEVRPFLDEARAMRAKEIGFTGGEPFMNPDILTMLEDALGRGFKTLVLTNGMRPMMRPRMQAGLLRLRARYGGRLCLRVSLDHYTRERHDLERGEGSFDAAFEGLSWLSSYRFSVAVATRGEWGKTELRIRAGFAKLFKAHGVRIDARDPNRLVLFPEMDEAADVPEITTACWKILDKNPKTVMCASARMIAKRKGAAAPVVLACTLIPYQDQFELGARLRDSTTQPVKLNHPHCAKFCVLGGASCSRA